MSSNDYIRDYLMHYGTPRHSGRYPYGSGENPRAFKRYAKAQKRYEKAAKRQAKAIRKLEKAENRSNYFERNVKQGKGKPNISKAEDISKSVSYTSNELISAGHKIINGLPKKKSSYEDLSGISDKELQRINNRLQMEQRYYSLTNQDTSKGREIASAILDTVGTTVSVAGGIVSIIAAAKALKK